MPNTLYWAHEVIPADIKFPAGKIFEIKYLSKSLMFILITSISYNAFATEMRITLHIFSSKNTTSKN